MKVEPDLKPEFFEAKSLRGRKTSASKVAPILIKGKVASDSKPDPIAEPAADHQSNPKDLKRNPDQSDPKNLKRKLDSVEKSKTPEPLTKRSVELRYLGSDIFEAAVPLVL